MAGVDRSAQERDGTGHLRMLFSLHEGNRRQDWHGGLAHRHHVQVWSQRREHADAVVHVIREIELALRQGTCLASLQSVMNT